MSYVYFNQCKTRQYGKNNEVGIHLKKPTANELADALDVAIRDGFKHIFVYDSSKTIVDTADNLTKATGLLIGWSRFCLTLPAFRIDYNS